MPQAAVDRSVTVVSEHESGEQVEVLSDDRVSPASASSPPAAGGARSAPAASSARRRSANNANPRKRHPQNPPASELRYPRRRSTKACSLCRARKTKCDNAHPTCGFCSSVGANCTYGDTQSSHASFDPASAEILRTLGQLVDCQKELLEAVRSGNSQPDAAPPHVTASSFAPNDRRLTHPWEEEETVPWTSPGCTQSAAPEPMRSGPCPILTCHGSNHSQAAGTPLDRPAQDPLLTAFAETSPGAFAVDGNPGALRWLGLLANDAAGREVTPANEGEEDVSRGLLDDGSFADSTALQKATRIVDGSLGTIEESSYLLSSVDGDVGFPRRMPEKQLWQAKDAIQLLPSEKVHFENFVQHISLWIDLFDPRRHFSSVVPRLAELHNAGLMNAILALSCHHHALRHDSVSPETTHANDALQYYYQTLHYVQKAMRHPSYQSSKELIATTLIISMYEMLAGSQKDWERHLQGVFFILRSQNINVEIEALESAVWWAWLRQDIWAAFRNKRKTHTAWVPKKTYSTMNPYEMASRAFWQLAQVINFCSPATVHATDPSRLCEQLKTVEQLLRMLNEWRQSLPVEFDPLPSSSEDPSGAFRPLLMYPPCYGLAIQAHYVARILLSFHEPSFGGVTVYLDRMKSLSSWIHIVCGVGMTLTDVASSVLSSQCMFIAGIFTQDRQERKCILQLLAGCRSRTGWPTSPLEDELEAIWLPSARSKGISGEML